MLASSLCLSLALHVAACEHALAATDAQVPWLFAPVRQLERSARLGLEGFVGKRTADGLTFFIGPALDWQLRAQVYLSIEGRF